MERMASLLSIEDLRVAFSLGKKETTVLRGINLSILGNEIHGLVGESGSGKTVTSTCIIGLLPIPPARILSGHIYFDGKDLLSLPEDQMRTYRGRKIAMIFQEPAKYLNPAFKIGEQIIEMLMLHMGMKKRSAYERVVELLRLVGLDEKVIDSYPHELSGGMKQRAMIAMAISCDPDLIIADEPTTALDVTLQVQILALLKKLKDMRKLGVLFISHDLYLVSEIADRVSVIYAGRIVESATEEELFRNPLHPYTRLLMHSIPDAKKKGSKLATIPGQVPDAAEIGNGCAFANRCPIAKEDCFNDIPSYVEYENAHTVACYYAGKIWQIL